MESKSIPMKTFNVESDLTSVGGLNLPQSALKYIVNPRPDASFPFYNRNDSILTTIGRGALIGLTAPFVYPMTKMVVVPAGHVGLAWHGADPTFFPGTCSDTGFSQENRFHDVIILT
eukprot:TRINITY_DN7563_c0_g1_i1.p2 TRINITY_DN7563_c0_g1~~TRINITY_DN7563_c0_g1_i1.p2  ORF type:complete len:117 (-),score=9.02 TRINITY_DN7563_c0_g1_i1:191-541(-)